MVRRVGVGATTASALIFSVILISNLAVYYASQGRELSYSRGNLADSYYVGGRALMGSEGTNALLRLQGFLGSGPFECQGAMDSAAKEVQGFGESETEGGVTSRVAVTLASAGASADNLSMLAPYAGYAPSGVSLALHFSVVGGLPASGVYYARDETHFVNLPVRLVALARDCTGALSDLEAALESSSPGNCTSTDLSPLVAAAAREPESAARLDGFGLGVSFEIKGQNPCSVALDVQIEQGGVQGPGGIFTVELKATGYASPERVPS